MSRPSAAPRYYESEHELQRLREELFRPRAVLRKHQSSSSRPRDLQLVEDPPASSGMLAWVDRFVAPPPTSPTLKSAPPIGTLHVQVSPDDSTYRVRNIRPDGARTHVRRPSAQEVQDRLRQLPSANNHHHPSSPGVIGNLPMRSNSFNRRASNHLPPSPAAVPIAPVRRHQPGTADLHLRLNVQDANPVWDGSQDWMMVERGGGAAGFGGVGPRPPLIRAPPPPRPPRPNNVNIFDDDLPKRPPPLSLSSSTSSSSSSGQSSRNPSPQTPTSPATPSAWTSYYTDRGNDANSEQQQQVEPPLPPLPAPMARSPPASMGFGRRAKSPPSYGTRAVRPTVNLTGGTTASGSLTSIGNLMTTTSPIPTSPIPESTLRALGLDDDDDSPSPFSENALNAREEERTRERALRRSASTATRRERSLPPPPEPVQEERGRQNTSNRRERSRPPPEQEERGRQNAYNRRERSQPPPPEPAEEEPERQNAFSRLRDFTRARSKSLSGRDSSRRRRTPSPPSRAPPLPTSPLVSTPNSARTIRAPGSPRPLYHMDFLAPHTDGDNNGPQSRPHSIAVSESSVITAGGTRYNIRNKALRVVNAAPSATSGSSRGSIASRSSLGSTITALFSHSTSSKSSVSEKTTTSSSKSSDRLESLKARALEEDIYRALNLPHVPYYSPSPSSRGDSPLPPPSFTFQDYSSSPRSSILSSPSSPRAKYAGINVDPQNRLEFDVRRTLEELSLVEEEVWGKSRVQAWEKEPDLENTDDAAMGLETLVRVEWKKRGRTRPERRGPIALRVPRR